MNACFIAEFVKWPENATLKVRIAALKTWSASYSLAEATSNGAPVTVQMYLKAADRHKQRDRERKAEIRKQKKDEAERVVQDESGIQDGTTSTNTGVEAHSSNKQASLPFHWPKAGLAGSHPQNFLLQRLRMDLPVQMQM